MAITMPSTRVKNKSWIKYLAATTAAAQATKSPGGPSTVTNKYAANY